MFTKSAKLFSLLKIDKHIFFLASAPPFNIYEKETEDPGNKYNDSVMLTENNQANHSTSGEGELNLRSLSGHGSALQSTYTLSLQICFIE